MMRYFLCFLLFCLLACVLKVKDRYEGVGDGWNWGAQYKTHKESIKIKHNHTTPPQP